MKKFAICLLVFAAHPAASAEKAASVTAGRDGATAPHTYSIKVEVPAPSLSTGSDGSTQILLPGYRVQGTRLGAPDLGFTTYRVAIPPGVTPRLETRILKEDFVTGIRPRPIPHVRFDVGTDLGARDLQSFDSLTANGLGEIGRHELFDEDPAIYAGTSVWPAEVATLGEVGAFRDQRYVIVNVSPARYDPKAGGVRVARKIELEIHFDGDTGERTAPVTDAQFESTYREMFINYADGKTFRLGATSSSAAPSAVRAMLDGPSYSGPVYKIKIRQNRTVRVDGSMLSAQFLAQPLSTWKLTSRGVEVPLQINDVNSNNMMDAGDWVQFWGQALDDEPKTTLNTDIPGTDVDIFQAADFSDENIYFLSVEAGSRLRMTTRDVAPTFSRPVTTTFEGIARSEVDNAWRPLATNDPWYWAPALRSTATKTRIDTVAVPGLASTTSPIRVVVRVRGLTENSGLFPDHHSKVTLLNQLSQSLMVNNDDGTFDGRMVYTHDFTWPGAPGIASDPVQVRLDAEPITSGFHEVMLDRIEIHYQRSFQAFSDMLQLTWADGDGELIVTGLTSAAAPEAWETTLKTNGISEPVRLTGMAITGPSACPPPGVGSCYTARLRIDNDPDLADGTLRQIVVFGAGGIAAPAGADFAADVQSDLLLPTNQADIIVISHSSVLGATCQPKLDQLLEWRDVNQGLSSKIVSIDDIYDEFNDGLAGPDGIRKFLEYVMSANPGEGWLQPKPAYVLLLGDGSNDYKGGPAAGNVVPTQVMFKDDPAFGYFSSDSYLTAVVGSDYMPDIAVGRIPVRSDAECFAAISKILSYQESPPTGNWRRHALVISDHGKNFNVNESNDFEHTNDVALDWMKRPPHTSRRLRYWTDYCGGTAAGCTCAVSNLMRNDIKAAVNGTDGQSDGVGIMQFVGHGNFDVWSDDSFFDNGPPGNRTACQPNGERDSDSLDNLGKLPMLFVHNCLSSGLPSTAHTLGRDMFKKADGGVVAMFSPSGLTSGYYGQEVSDVVWNSFFGKTKERTLAVPVMNVYANLCGGGVLEACENYLLFGDPATRAAFPTVASPTGIVAAPGNARVDLSWTASTTPGARYDIYRVIDNPLNAYTRINGNTPVTATSYADTNPPTGLINAKTYYYYLVAVDNELFESRYSHFNSDCAVNGPDCLKAKPLNPNPPAAPTGVVVVDAEVGGKLIVSWTANLASDEIKSYQVLYGTSSGDHSIVANAGTLTSVALTGLANGQPYFIVVRATNTSDLTSTDSAEVNGIPTFVRGLRAPQFISDLHVDKSGNDAMLSWPPVTSDIYDKPTTIDHYEIYRGTTANFVPAPGNKIGQTTSTSFPDPGALGAGPAYHYLVQAVDTQGSRSGLGNQLPNGVDPLLITKSTVTPGNIVLSWPAVTTDFDNIHPVAIDHYEIYARSTPFRMADVRDQLIPMIQSTSSTSIELTPPAGAQYYSVVSVDLKGNKSPF